MSEVEVLPQDQGPEAPLSLSGREDPNNLKILPRQGWQPWQCPQCPQEGVTDPATEIKQWGDPGIWGRSPQAV